MTYGDKTKTLLPNPQIAGILPGDSNIEFIGNRDTKTVIWLQNGAAHYFKDLPEQYFNLLKEAYGKDEKAVCFLKEISKELTRQVELYTYYMYGAADETPDIKDGVLSPSENFRDKKDCPSLLWNSKNINIGDHVLTPRQLLIIDLVAENLPDKAIAKTLGIAHQTLDFHKRKLFTALGITTKVELIKLSINNKISA